MKTVITGQAAETKAAEYLYALGYTIVDVNWRTKACEIDIIAKKDALYFIEVKYRRTNKAGAGLDYITPSKLQKMKFAAEQWLNSHEWSGEICLGAIEVSGPNFEIGEFISQLDQ